MRLEEINTLYAKIALYLNFNGDIEKLIHNNMGIVKDCLSEMITHPKTCDIHALNERTILSLRYILSCSRVLLKLEWNRVKREAASQTYTEDDYKAEKKKLLNDYWSDSPYKDIADPRELLKLL